MVRVRRDPFDDIATEATTVTISTTDPSGIFGSLPSSVVIPVGEDSIEFDFDMSGIAGDGTITLSGPGGTFETLEFESAGQAFVADWPAIYMPAGSKLAYVFHSRHVSDFASGIGFDVDFSDASMDSEALLTSGYIVPPGATVGTFEVSAGAVVGTHTMTISDPGATVSDLVVPVHVRTSDFAATRTLISLSDMASRDEGKFVIHAPDGVTFSSATGPAGSSTYLTISGTGTETLVLEFAEGATRPDDVDVTIAMAGTTPGEAYDLIVNDAVRPTLPAHYFFITVP